MNYSEFSQKIKSGEVGGAYLLHGDEEYIKALSVGAVNDKFIADGLKDLNYFKLDASECDISKIEEAIIPFPFMSEKRVVEVYGLELLKTNSSKQNKDDMSRLSQIINRCSDETVLLFIVQGKASSGAVKLFSEENRSIDFKLPNESQKIQYLKRMAKKAELVISDNVLKILVQYTGMNLLELELELNKIKAYVDEKEVGQEDILAICPPAVEYNIFKMLKHITNRQGGEALAEYRKLMLSGQSPQAVTAMIARQFRSLFYLKELNGLSNEDLKKAAGKLGTKDFVIKNMNRIASRLDENRIQEIVEWCADADYMVKSGKISVDNSAEILIMRLITI